MLVLGLAASSGALLYQGSAAAASYSPGHAHQTPAVATGQVAAPAPALPAPAVCRTVGVPPAPATTRSSSHAAAVVTVGVAVLGYVDVELNSAGTPVAVRTNTGSGPDCEATWFVFGPHHPHGDALESVAEVNRVIDMAASNPALPAPGKWQPGTWCRIGY
jgi:hypothetical protein